MDTWSCSSSVVACCRHLNSWGTVELVVLAGGLLQSDNVEDSSLLFSRTSFTISAGDLKTNGGSGDEDFLVNECLLLGGL